MMIHSINAYGKISGTAHRDLVPDAPPLTIRIDHGGSMYSTEIPYGFCHCGCGGKTNISKLTCARDGYVKGEPKRFVFGHNRRLTTPEYLIEDRGYRTPCWVWQRHVTTSGYGSRKINGMNLTTHILSYEQKCGPIPEGLELDHLCRVRRCCNPDHLEPVTRLENVRRGANTKLTLEDVRRIREVGETMTRVAIGKMFGITGEHVHGILTGKTW